MQYLVKGASGVGSVFLPKVSVGDTIKLSPAPIVGDVFDNRPAVEQPARMFNVLSVGRAPSGQPDDTDEYPTIWVSPVL